MMVNEKECCICGKKEDLYWCTPADGEEYIVKLYCEEHMEEEFK